MIASSRKRNPEATKAHTLIRMHIKRGLVVPPYDLLCSECTYHQARDYHHYKGYDHPLDVIPLCRSCHTKEHNKLGFRRVSADLKDYLLKEYIAEMMREEQ